MAEVKFDRRWHLEFDPDRSLYLAKCQCGDCFIVKTTDDALDALNHTCWPKMGDK